MRDDVTRGAFLLNTSSIGSLDIARLDAALSAANDAFFDVDLASRTIRWSRGIKLLFGHDPDRIGVRLADWQRLIHPEDLDPVLASGRAVLPAGASVWSDEFRLARADGSYAPVRVRAFVVADGGRPSHVVGSVIDLSDLRDREREVRALTHELADRMSGERIDRIRSELLLRAARTDVLGELDLETRTCVWSPNVGAILGWSAEELCDLDAFLRHAHPEDGPRALADLERRVAEGAAMWSGRFRFAAGSGEELLLEGQGHVLRDETGRPIKVVGSIVTVTEQRSSSRGEGAPILTDRQRQVLGLVREGRTNKEIAGHLGISEQAVKVQVSKLLRKFGAPNRAALAALPPPARR